MFEQQKVNETYLCPQCQQKLTWHEADLICPNHGVFFVYGSNLLVRSARQDDDKGTVTLPWEKPTSALA